MSINLIAVRRTRSAQFLQVLQPRLPKSVTVTILENKPDRFGPGIVFIDGSVAPHLTCTFSIRPDPPTDINETDILIGRNLSQEREQDLTTRLLALINGPKPKKPK